MRLNVNDRETVKPGSELSSPRRLRVAVAGLGVIGEGAALRLSDASDAYLLCAALVRDPHKARANGFEKLRVYSDPGVMLAEHPDVVIDALPSGVVGRRLIEAALSQGASVVTANKQAIAGAMAPLHTLAANNDAVFAYSASVGGGAPMVETVRKARRAGEIESITGILNGTVNYLLSAMKTGADFESAVKSAQDAGFAEPDPSADLSGEDARAKISILTYDAFGEEIDLNAIAVEALDAKRAESFVTAGGVWKQLAQIQKTRGGAITAEVSFVRVDDDPFLRKIEGEGNALSITNADGREFVCEGKGAGRAPTVASIFSDLEKIAPATPFR